MTRLLVILAVLLLVWMGTQRFFAAVLRSPEGRQLAALWRLFAGAGQTATPRAGAGTRESQSDPSQLVRCARCNTHVPVNRALRSPRTDGSYCSQECVDAAESA